MTSQPEQYLNNSFMRFKILYDYQSDYHFSNMFM
jgi:hypothetical protein